MWLQGQIQQTSQCWALKELAKNIRDSPGAQNVEMTDCNGYRGV
ncbi:Uncharacterised protein [Salmonella enterica subsp. houtenae]|nr:Uncharacterised protein [Salmonella enterica subsp. houtenae]